MKAIHNNSREAVYEAPIIPWNNGTYTPISNKSIMDLMDEKLRELNLRIRGEEYRTSTTSEGLVRGVIGKYYISSTNNEFGHQLLFRNSYDKSMSFAFAVGNLVWACSNGCVSGDYVYKRTHLGTFEGDTTSTWNDIQENMMNGFSNMQESFEVIVDQMNKLKYFELGPSDTYNILGELFFDKEIINITQLSVVKRELQKSHNFKHIDNDGYSAYDLYNHITESLKTTAPNLYLKSHVSVHELFTKTFGV